MALKIRKGDIVQVIAGDDRGKTGRVLSIDEAKQRLIVEKVNFVKRHTKARRQGQQGGILEKEGSVEASNVALWCGKCAAPRRARVDATAEGKNKKRICAKCGSVFETT